MGETAKICRDCEDPVDDERESRCLGCRAIAEGNTKSQQVHKEFYQLLRSVPPELLINQYKAHRNE